MKTPKQNSEEEILRYEAEIESLKQEMFWAMKEHEMRIRKMAKILEETQGHLSSEKEFLDLHIRSEEWSKKHQQKTLPLE